MSSWSNRMEEKDSQEMSENKKRFLEVIYNRIEEIENRIDQLNSYCEPGMFRSPSFKERDLKSFQDLLKINYIWLRAIDKMPLVRQ